MFTGVSIPYISYIGVLTADPKERLSANGYRMFFAKIANWVIISSIPALASMWGNGDPAKGYQLAMALMSFVGVLLLVFCLVSARERVEHVVDNKPLSEQFKLLLKNDQWLVLAACCVFGTLGYAMRGGVALYYAIYFLGASEIVAGQFVGAGIVASIASMVASTWITKRYCKLQLFPWSQLAVMLFSAALCLLCSPGGLWVAFVVFLLWCLF